MKMFKFIIIDPVKSIIEEFMPIYYFILGATVAGFIYVTAGRDDIHAITFIVLLVTVSVIYFVAISVFATVISLLLHGIVMIHPRIRKKIIEKVYENDTQTSP